MTKPAPWSALQVKPPVFGSKAEASAMWHGPLTWSGLEVVASAHIGEGLGNTASFETCQHGAGRTLGRNAAKRAKTSTEVFAEMAAWGIEFFTNEPRTAAEEAAFAYKDIEAVMALSADLVRPITRLRPLGVVKG